MQQIITVKGRRVFRPWEYQIFRSELKESQRVIADILLLTGMRYEELLRLRYAPDWIDEVSGMIHLPSVAVKKGRHLKETVQTERWVRMSIRAKGVIPMLYRVEMTSRTAFDQMLKRKSKLAAIEHPDFIPDRISVISFRKTCASWLRIYYPMHMDHILLSMGHSKTTELKHYLGLPFTDIDKSGMSEWVEGWI